MKTQQLIIACIFVSLASLSHAMQLTKPKAATPIAAPSTSRTLLEELNAITMTGKYQQVIARAIAENNINITYGYSQETPLHLIASCGTLEQIRAFIAHKPDVKILDNQKRSVLHHLTYNPNVTPEIFALVRSACLNKVDVNQQDNNGYTVLHLVKRKIQGAVAHNRENEKERWSQIRSFLITAGALTTVKNIHGETPEDFVSANQ